MNKHPCEALPATTDEPAPSQRFDARTHPIPTQEDAPPGRASPERAGRPQCRVHLAGETVSQAKKDRPGGAGTACEALAKVRLARDVVLPPLSRGYFPVQAPFNGNGVFTQSHQVYECHRVHVAPGTMDCTADQTWWVEETHAANTSRHRPKGVVFGHISAYSSRWRPHLERNGPH